MHRPENVTKPGLSRIYAPSPRDDADLHTTKRQRSGKGGASGGVTPLSSSAMGGKLDVRLLGTPQVTVDGAPVEVDTRKAIAMLAYLAIEKTADRNTLAGLFWADSSPDRARATLRRTLSSLRGGIGSDTIDADRDRATLADGFRCDVDEFREAIEDTATHGHEPNDVCSSCIAPLTRAAGLYRGDFLGAFSVRDAPEFEDWARAVGESLRLEAGNVFGRLAMALASTGDYYAAIAAAGRWLDLDELHEPAHRLMMLLNAWSGDRAGAIQAYRGCVAILDLELGVSPLEETTQLFEAILDEDLPPAPAIPRTVKTHTPPSSPAPTELIDRSDAVETLESAVESSRLSSLLCLLTGDSWMGKTRLLEHVADYASRRGHLVAQGTAFRAETTLPYGVATQVLEGLLTGLDGGPQVLPSWAVEELTRLDPRIVQGQSAPEIGQLGQLRLQEAFLTLMEAAGSQSPLLIAVDDAQWIDAASASLLAYLQRRAGDLRLLIVLSARDPDSLHPALSEVVADSDDTVELAPLAVSDLAGEFGDTDLAGIIEATGGIPLLVKEAIESGGVGPDSSTVIKYMTSRRRRMSELASQILSAAAVLNGMCDANLLRDTSGRTEEETVDAVEELVAAGLLREHEDGRIGFSLDVLETMTYESTSLIRRRLLHRRAAGAISSRPRADTDPRMVTATAEHLRAAGSDEAAAWYKTAGDLASEVFAHDEAVTAYENALALGYTPVGEPRLALGELAMTRGEYELATRELRTAASHSEGSTLALVEHRIGELHRLLGRFELAEESFRRAETDHPFVADLYADWALLKHRIGDSETATALATRSLEAARVSGDDDQLARSLNILGLATPDSRGALTQFDAALALTDSTDPARMAALNNKAHLLSENGDPEGAIALVNEAIGIAEAAGYRHHQAALFNHLADLHHQSGHDHEAEESLTEAVRIFANIGTEDWEPEVWFLRQW